MRMTLQTFLFSVMLILPLALSGCGGVESEAKYPTGLNRSATGDDIYAKPKGIFGDGGLSILGGEDKNTTDVITVNSYLWRASLDTVNFMPIANVDPFGGVILTDWYSNPNTPTERYKLNVFVLGSQLRSDGVKVSMFKQRKTGSAWANVAVDTSTNREIEDAILTRAREIRVASTQDK